MRFDLTAYPAFPPGLWRRIDIRPAPGEVVGGLEDDVHRFVVGLRHEGGVITAVDTREERIPWSTCAGAGAFLGEQLVGKRLAEVAAIDPHVHCTHLIELAVVCAALAEIAAPVRFDLKIADRVDDRTSGRLEIDGVPALTWFTQGTMIEGPAEWAGRDLRRLSTWKAELSPEVALQAMMLRRALMVSGARRQPEDMQRGGPERIGACYTYQLPRANEAVRSPNWRKDFSAGSEGPLKEFHPERMFARQPGRP